MEKWQTYRSDDPVNPEMLVMARVLRGYTLEYAAEVSGIALETLRRYEASGGVLPERDFRMLARGYGFPIPFFLQEGKMERRGHICYAHDPADVFLAPLQALLDGIVGDEKIANVEWLDDGIYRCHYDSDGDPQPHSKIRLGTTLAQAEKRLRALAKRVSQVSP